MPKTARNTGLDALRGLAVVLMVEQHLGVWLASWRGAQSFWFSILLALNALGGAAAPLFLVISGFGAAQASAGARQWIGRALCLAAFAYALNVATPLWFSWGSFYVLHTIAAFWLCVPLVARLPTRAIFALALLVVAGSFAAASFLETPLALNNARMNDSSLPGGVLRLALAEGHFPLLPWLALPLWGYWAGRMDGLGCLRRAQASAAALVALGLVLTLLGLWRPAWLWKLHLLRAVHFSFYPAAPAFIFTLGGLALLAACIAQDWGRRSQPGVASFWVPLGRLSLSILFVHVIVFRQLAGAWGLTYRLGAGPGLAAIAVVLVALAWASARWARADYLFSLEWWVRRVGLALAGPPGSRGPAATSPAPDN